MITISVSIRQHEPILHGRHLGDYSPNQVASSKILGAMATKMVATWRVVLRQQISLQLKEAYQIFSALLPCYCLLYTSDAADEEDSVDLGGRRIIKKKK